MYKCTNQPLILALVGLSFALICSAQVNEPPTQRLPNGSVQFLELNPKIPIAPGYEVDKNGTGTIAHVPYTFQATRSSNGSDVGPVLAPKNSSGQIDEGSRFVANALQLKNSTVKGQPTNSTSVKEDSGMSAWLIVGLIVLILVGLIIGLVYLYRYCRH